MGSLLRSEEMALCQLFLQSESAYSCVSELGELGLVQFRDLNPDVSAFQRKFVSEVRRCDEMERKLRYVEKEINKEKIPMLDAGDNPDAPAPREMIDLEASFEKLENELKDVNANTETLSRNYLELTELKHILRSTQYFFAEHERSLPGNMQELSIRSEQPQTLHLGFVAGVILWEKLPSFERMLWRVCRGNVFLKQTVIDTPMLDPVTGDEVIKCVFIVFFQGDQLQSRVKKICEGFRATLYPVSDSSVQRGEMSMNVMTRLEDLITVLKETTDHRHRVLVLAAKNLKSWFIKVKKIKAIYHTLNMFNLDVTQKCLIAECWVATVDLDKIHQALQRGQDRSGGSVPSILNRISTAETPPTFHRTNKFTRVFQSLIDAYGVSTYREVNPAPFSIITFPFLFSVMFGDFGHGFIMFLAALWMVLRERQLMATKSSNEIWNMFFGGRYLILMMGAFSVYAGLLYNDIFSLSVNFFGSKWRAPEAVYMMNATTPQKEWLKSAILDPSPYIMTQDPDGLRHYTLRSNLAQNLGSPYPFGIDPIWALASNKLTFINSFKMKLSIILGVIHMMFGLWLGLVNHIHFSNTINIFCEFIPQVLFLSCTFLFLVVEIMYKWVAWDARTPNGPTLTGCSPNLLIGMINMYLFTAPVKDNVVNDLHWGNYTCSAGNPAFGEPGQLLQQLLVIVIVICIPWILVPKPLLLWRRRKYKKPARLQIQEQGDGETGIIHQDELQAEDVETSEGSHGEEDGMGEIIVHQAIHTIEFCLGCISHTASYLRLWALSLAHGQLSEVLWTMVMKIGLTINSSSVVGGEYAGAFVLMLVFPAWAFLTVAVLLAMEGLSAFLHTLRLHWVEFNSKFYHGEGYAFEPFQFAHLLEESSE